MKQSYTGKVRWFDRSSGKGMIRVDGTEESVWVYACNIKGARTWYPETACIYLVDGQDVTFTFVEGAEDCGACEVTGGVRDDEHWDRIKDQNLAFRCDDEGNAVNGLFSEGK